MCFGRLLLNCEVYLKSKKTLFPKFYTFESNDQMLTKFNGKIHIILKHICMQGSENTCFDLTKNHI